MVGFCIGLLAGLCTFVVSWIFYLYFHKPNGRLLIGRNNETGMVVYRFEYYDENSIPNMNTVSFKVVHTDKNLGINQKLYDIGEELDR